MIINSFLDMDFYKLTMGQLVFNNFPKVKVKYQLTNRSKNINLGDLISKQDLETEIEHIRKIRITDEEFFYLKSLKIFSGEYLKFLKQIKLSKVLIKQVDHDLRVSITGLWSEAIYWETFILSILTELYSSAIINQTNRSGLIFIKQGKQNLSDKIEKLGLYPKIKFADFGTRRRLSFAWQQYVLKTFQQELPNQIVGTSNVKLAEKLNMKPVGTFAHELYMVLYGLEMSISSSHEKVLGLWYDQYGLSLSIALTDNYGSDFFFKKFTKEQVLKWSGLRHDSGDPIGFGEKAIKFYEKSGIDPLSKTIVFSDGLDVDSIIDIFRHFNGRIKTVFGWGTNLTNDVGFAVPQIVIKPIEVNGKKVGKLTDSKEKNTGDNQVIKKLKEQLRDS